VSLTQLISAQTRDLPSCSSIQSELITIKNSFDNIVEKFKSKEDKISLIKTYFSEFSICDQKGKIKDYGKNVEFSFFYTDADYKGGKGEFFSHFERIFRSLTEIFVPTHYIRFSESDAGRSYFFYETGKDISTSKRIIRLSVSYLDPVDETEAYSVSLIFEYYPKR
jgi:hypothetical protein